jgi:hypothetical protein
MADAAQTYAKVLARMTELKRYAREYTRTTWTCEFCLHEESEWSDMADHLLDEHHGKLRLGELEKEIGIEPAE